MVGLSGCISFGQQKEKIEIVGDYCQGKYYELPKDPVIEDDIKKISAPLYFYIQANETTFVCDCLEAKEKEKCYRKFLKKEGDGKTKIISK